MLNIMTYKQAIKLLNDTEIEILEKIDSDKLVEVTQVDNYIIVKELVLN